MILVFDEGHGGNDPGACSNGLQEAPLTSDIAHRVAVKLEPYDVKIEFAPRSDNLNERAAFANNLGADYFVSYHINAGGGTGFESYVYTGADDDTERIRAILHNTIYGGYLAGQGVVDRGKKRANFAVLRETYMPAVLLENLFIDTAKDAARLSDPAFLNGLANEIAYGLVVALNIPRKQVAQEVQGETAIYNTTIEPVTIKVAGHNIEGILVNDLSYAPVRKLAEAVGYKVESWDGDNKVATLTKVS